MLEHGLRGEVERAGIDRSDRRGRRGIRAVVGDGDRAAGPRGTGRYRRGRLGVGLDRDARDRRAGISADREVGGRRLVRPDSPGPGELDRLGYGRYDAAGGRREGRRHDLDGERVQPIRDRRGDGRRDDRSGRNIERGVAAVDHRDAGDRDRGGRGEIRAGRPAHRLPGRCQRERGGVVGGDGRGGDGCEAGDEGGEDGGGDAGLPELVRLVVERQDLGRRPCPRRDNRQVDVAVEGNVQGHAVPERQGRPGLIRDRASS